MGEIKLNRDDSERLLADQDADPGTRLVAALAIAFFEVNDSAEDASPEFLSIARKLLHMTERVIYDELDEREAAS